MAEYIEREALSAELYKLRMEAFRNNDQKACVCYNNAYVAIVKAPAADVAPVVHGRWEPHYEHDFVSDEDVLCGLHCSLCGLYYVKRHNYCPNCGARMDGDSIDK